MDPYQHLQNYYSRIEQEEGYDDQALEMFTDIQRGNELLQEENTHESTNYEPSTGPNHQGVYLDWVNGPGNNSDYLNNHTGYPPDNAGRDYGEFAPFVHNESNQPAAYQQEGSHQTTTHGHAYQDETPLQGLPYLQSFTADQGPAAFDQMIDSSQADLQSPADADPPAAAATTIITATATNGQDSVPNGEKAGPNPPDKPHRKPKARKGVLVVGPPPADFPVVQLSPQDGRIMEFHGIRYTEKKRDSEFKCLGPGCVYSYNKFGCRRHFGYEHADHCSLCGMKIEGLAKISDHVKGVHGNGTIEYCPFCKEKKKYSRVDVYQEHILRHILADEAVGWN